MGSLTGSLTRGCSRAPVEGWVGRGSPRPLQGSARYTYLDEKSRLGYVDFSAGRKGTYLNGRMGTYLVEYHGSDGMVNLVVAVGCLWLREEGN